VGSGGFYVVLWWWGDFDVSQFAFDAVGWVFVWGGLGGCLFFDGIDRWGVCDVSDRPVFGAWVGDEEDEKSAEV